MSKGFVCECGKYHVYDLYVFEHANTALVHTCDACGRKHRTQHFESYLIPDTEPRSEKK
jgi:hypothetical protein